MQGAVSVAENVVRLYFNTTPYFTGLLDPYDASQVSCYEIVPAPGPKGFDDNPPRVVNAIAAKVGEDPYSIDVAIDRPMSPWPSNYQVYTSGMADAASKTPAPTQTLTYQAVYRALVPPSAHAATPSRDLANPQTLLDLAASGAPNYGAVTNPLGTYVVDATGDYAFDQGLVSLKKRILRRFLTVPGSFAHLPPGYGLGILTYGKKLVRPGVLGKLIASAQAQIAQEPEVLQCAVTAKAQPNGLVYFKIAVRLKNGQKQVFGLSFPSAPTT